MSSRSILPLYELKRISQSMCIEQSFYQFVISADRRHTVKTWDFFEIWGINLRISGTNKRKRSDHLKERKKNWK